MKFHIRWIFFKNEEIKKLIFNQENNENWPSEDTYWNWKELTARELKKQQEEINRLEIKNNKTRRLMANVQTWFINEHNLLGKPAKRNWLEKQAKLRQLEQELRNNDKDLNNPKQKLEEYEKKCLLNKIRIGKRKIGNCKDELTEAEKAYEQEKRELCQRLTYERSDLEPFLRNPEESIDPITRKLVINSKHYSEWWKIFHDIDEKSKPLAELNKCLTEWYKHNEGEGPEYEPHEIWVEEKTDDAITFLWKPVEIELQRTNEKGKKEIIKGKFLPLLRNYLFNYYGEWFEVVGHSQVNYDTLIILAQRSIFYNGYERLSVSETSVIALHAPKELASEEICSCPSYEIYTTRRSFELDYELKFDLYRIGKNELKTQSRATDNSGTFEMFYCGVPWKVANMDREWADLNNELFIDPKNPPSFWSFTAELTNYLFTNISNFFAGKKSVLYLLLGRRLNGGTWSSFWFGCPTNKTEINNTPAEKRLFFREIDRDKSYDEQRQVTNLSKKIKENFLEEKGLLADSMHHFLKTHIKATLFWRKKPVWRGNYWEIHNQMRITESISAAGTCITFEGSGRILGWVKELVSAKVGVDKNGFLGILITTATTIAVAAVPGAGPAVLAAKAGIGLAGGMAQMGANELMNTPSYTETSETMTINEFRHRFQWGKIYPISIELEYNQELANQYLNKRELKGPMLYTYKNLGPFGNYLVIQPSKPDGHFLRLLIISWNMTHDSEWWREKIEKGVYIYKENHLNFYLKALSRGNVASRQGGIVRGSWNETTFMKSCGIKGGWDSIADRGGGFWVYKIKGGQPNYIRPKGGGHDFLPDIMKELQKRHSNFINKEDSSKWTVSWPEPEFVEERWDIPEKYKNNRLEGGKACCDIEFRLDFFTDGDRSKPGEKFWITHILVSKTNAGTRSDLNFNFQGEIVRITSFSDVNGIPPSTALPTDPNTVDIPPSTPFNPNRFPSSGNLVPNPTGSGEAEAKVPDIDNGSDPDWDQSADNDLDKDKDLDDDQDDDNEIDILPPDNPFDIDNNDND